LRPADAGRLGRNGGRAAVGQRALPGPRRRHRLLCRGNPGLRLAAAGRAAQQTPLPGHDTGRTASGPASPAGDAVTALRRIARRRAALRLEVANTRAQLGTRRRAVRNAAGLAIAIAAVTRLVARGRWLAALASAGLAAFTFLRQRPDDSR